MINILQLTCIAFCIVFFAGCSDKAYEDKDMTKAFFEKHGKDFSMFNKVEFSKTIGGDWRVYYRLKDNYIQSVLDEDVSTCNQFYFFFNKGWFSDSLKFKEKDVKEQGKEKMFNYAERCFLKIAEEINRRENEKRLGIERLDEKFVLPKNEDGNVSGKENQK